MYMYLYLEGTMLQTILNIVSNIISQPINSMIYDMHSNTGVLFTGI